MCNYNFRYVITVKFWFEKFKKSFIYFVNIIMIFLFSLKLLIVYFITVPVIKGTIIIDLWWRKSSQKISRKPLTRYKLIKLLSYLMRTFYFRSLNRPNMVIAFYFLLLQLYKWEVWLGLFLLSKIAKKEKFTNILLGVWYSKIGIYIQEYISSSS